MLPHYEPNKEQRWVQRNFRRKIVSKVRLDHDGTFQDILSMVRKFPQIVS